VAVFQLNPQDHKDTLLAYDGTHADPELSKGCESITIVCNNLLCHVNDLPLFLEQVMATVNGILRKCMLDRSCIVTVRTWSIMKK
jgi:hypothetical protein